MEIKSQLTVPIVFRGEKLDKAFTIDILVSILIIVELKSISSVLSVHEAVQHSIRLGRMVIGRDPCRLSVPPDATAQGEGDPPPVN